ncbi:hypothetical protein DESC_780195 [Desulfosarcina cetonica]|nr:hypothetical protein DESC_780195 [Desulfosarcina cetonica]
MFLFFHGERLARIKSKCGCPGNRHPRHADDALKGRRISAVLLVDQIDDGGFQFEGKRLRHLLVFKVAADIDRLFQGFEADLAGLARLDVRFDILAGGHVQLPVDIFRESFKKGNASLVGMVRISPFHSKSLRHL